MPKTTILMITYKRIDVLEKVFALHERFTPKETPIYVLDNSCDTQTAVWLQEHKLDNMHIKINKENVGFAKGVNWLFKQADSKYVCAINPDIFVEKDWLRKLECGMKKHLSDKIGIGGPKQVEENGSTCHQGTGYMRRKDGLIEPVNMKDIKFPGKEHDLEVQGISFSCAMIPDDVYSSYKLCEEYGLGFYEDQDFCCMIREDGYTAWYLPRPMLTHMNHASWDTHSHDKLVKQSFQNLRLFNRRWGHNIEDTGEWLRSRI